MSSFFFFTLAKILTQCIFVVRIHLKRDKCLSATLASRFINIIIILTANECLWVSCSILPAIGAEFCGSGRDTGEDGVHTHMHIFGSVSDILLTSLLPASNAFRILYLHVRTAR